MILFYWRQGKAVCRAQDIENIIEKFMLEGTFKIIVPIHPLPSPPLNHVPEYHVYMSFRYLQGWLFHHFPVCLSVPVLDNIFGEEILPDVQSKHPLTQSENILSHPAVTWQKRPRPTSFISL